MSRLPTPAYDLRWTRPNRLALGCLCVLAAGLLAAYRTRRPTRIDREIAVDPARVQAAAERINPNVASVASLRRLPQIGPARARAIVEYRRCRAPSAFRWAEDLTEVKGIGPATVRRIAPLLSLPRRGGPATVEAGGQVHPARTPGSRRAAAVPAQEPLNRPPRRP